MPWYIGIDEAGYGPSLGPLVQTAVGVWLPGEMPSCDLWRLLRAAVRKHGGKADGRLVIDDSKKVYGPQQGLRNLELGVLVVLGSETPRTVGGCLSRVAEASLPDLRGEPWFDESVGLPLVIGVEDLMAAETRFKTTCEAASLGRFLVRSRITPAPLFNTLLD